MASSKQVNDGFNTERSVDPVGYCDLESEHAPYYVTPMSYKVFDGNIEKHKPAVLILATLDKDAKLYSKSEEDKEDREFFDAKKGSLVAIWGKPGMVALRELAGIPVKIWQEGEKDTKKPNPMKLYKILTKDNAKGGKLPCIQDTRDKSFGKPCFLEDAGRPIKQNQPAGTNGNPDADDSEDIPF